VGALDDYFAAWNEPSRDRRRELLARSVDAHVEVIHPTFGRSEGIEQLEGQIEQYLSAMPDTAVVRSSEVDGHNQLVRYAWTIVDQDGTAANGRARRRGACRRRPATPDPALSRAVADPLIRLPSPQEDLRHRERAGAQRAADQTCDLAREPIPRHTGGQVVQPAPLEPEPNQSAADIDEVRAPGQLDLAAATPLRTELVVALHRVAGACQTVFWPAEWRHDALEQSPPIDDISRLRCRSLVEARVVEEGSAAEQLLVDLEAATASELTCDLVHAYRVALHHPVALAGERAKLSQTCTGSFGSAELVGLIGHSGAP
jgi:hypothetical protein